MLTRSSYSCCQRSCANDTAPFVYYKIIAALFQKGHGCINILTQSENISLDSHLLQSPKHQKNTKGNEMTSSALWCSRILPVCMYVSSTRSIAFTTLSSSSSYSTTRQAVACGDQASTTHTHTQDTQGRLEILWSTVTGGNNWFNGHVDS